MCGYVAALWRNVWQYTAADFQTNLTDPHSSSDMQSTALWVLTSVQYILCAFWQYILCSLCSQICNAIYIYVAYMLYDWLECSDKSWQLRHTTNQPCHQIHTDALHWKQRQSRNSSAQIGLHNTYALLILILATLGTLNANVPYIFIRTTNTAV